MMMGLRGLSGRKELEAREGERAPLEELEFAGAGVEPDT